MSGPERTTRIAAAALVAALLAPSCQVRRGATGSAAEPQRPDVVLVVVDTLRAELTTLAELLRDAGYATGAFVHQNLLHAGSGFDQGFETYRTSGAPGRAEEFHIDLDREVTDDALAWLASTAGGGRPVFLLVWYVAPHWPYRVPLGELQRELYDLRADPGETANLTADPAHAEALDDMGARLFDWIRPEDLRAVSTGDRRVLDPELEERLRSLGYVP